MQPPPDREKHSVRFVHIRSPYGPQPTFELRVLAVIPPPQGHLEAQGTTIEPEAQPVEADDTAADSAADDATQLYHFLHNS